MQLYSRKAFPCIAMNSTANVKANEAEADPHIGTLAVAAENAEGLVCNRMISCFHCPYSSDEPFIHALDSTLERVSSVQGRC